MFSCAVTRTPSHQNHGAKISANQEQNHPAFGGTHAQGKKQSLLGSDGKRADWAEKGGRTCGLKKVEHK
jgi:hypothetical protein